MASTAASERSPLLPRPADGEPASGTEQSGDPEAPPAPNGSAQGSSTPSQDDEALASTRDRMVYIFLAVAIGVLLAAADQTIIVSSYGKIGSELAALNKVSWIANAYFLTLTACQPMYGKLSDIFGRKACLLFAYAVFGAGCLCCGLARTMDELIVARALAGVGGGGMTTIVSILISDVIALRERGTWQGYINIVYASGAAVGAPLGGIIADYISWRWAFLVQTPMCLIALISVYFLLHLPKQDQSHWKEKIRRIDFLGALILLSAVATLLTGLDRGSNIAWSDTTTIVCLALSGPLMVIFVLVEKYVAAEPFAPGHVIFERSVFASYLCNYFSFAGYMGALFYAPYFYQAVYGKTATQASLLLLPSVICGVSGSLLGGLYMQRTGKYYWLTVGCYSGLVLGLAIFVAFASAPASTVSSAAHSSTSIIPASIPGMLLGMMLAAFSNGIGVTSTLIALLANSSAADQAIATACSYLFRSLGSVSGLALSATAQNQVLRTALAQRLGDGAEAARVAQGVRRSLAYLQRLAPETRRVVRECYAQSTRVAFAAQVVVVAGAVVAAMWIRERPLNR